MGGFFKFPYAFLPKIQSLSSSDFKVLIFTLSINRPENLFITRRTLAKKTGLSPRQVTRSISKLERLGIFKVFIRPGRCNNYIVIVKDKGDFILVPDRVHEVDLKCGVIKCPDCKGENEPGSLYFVKETKSFIFYACRFCGALLKLRSKVGGATCQEKTK